MTVAKGVKIDSGRKWKIKRKRKKDHAVVKSKFPGEYKI